jgi:polyisoprenoid-binding protein YceI
MGKSVGRSVLLALVLAVSAGPAFAGVDTYKIDQSHSTIGFSVRHLVSRSQGRFAEFGGTISFDPADHKTAVVALDIKAESIDTDNDKRDSHLRTGDFFQADSFPTISFKSTVVKPKDATSGVLVGDLTMKGVTKPVELQYTILGMGPGMRGSKIMGLEATGKINRRDFNVLWNRDLDQGATLLGDDVTLSIVVEAKTEPTEPPPPPPPAEKSN